MVFTTMIIHTNTQTSTAMMLMTMTMIIHSYQSQSYSSDANHTLHCIYNVMISGHAFVTM